MAKFKFSNTEEDEPVVTESKGSKQNKAQKSFALHPPEYLEAMDEAEKTGVPVQVRGVGTSGTPRLDPNEAIVTQLQNIWEKLVAIEMIVTANWPKKTPGPHPPVDTNGHPRLKNGMVAQWQEVPSKENLLKAAKEYIEKKGKKAFAALLEEFKARTLGGVTKDEDQARLMGRLTT